MMVLSLAPCAFIYICKRLSEAARQRTGGLCILNVPHPQHQALWPVPPTLQGQKLKSMVGQEAVLWMDAETHFIPLPAAIADLTQ